MTTSWIHIANIDDIPMLGARVIEGATAGPVAIFRTEGDEIFAVHDACPHKAGPLSQGIVHGKSVTCPLHSWNIGLENGCAAAPDEGCIKTYTVKIEQRRVFLDAAELTQDA